MADRPLSTPLPADLPEDWTTGQIVAPAGADAGLSEQHGYNYLMEQVNAVQRAVNAINESFDTISGKRTCRIVVGTSTAGWTQADCDYLCDGTDDQAELNAAIEAVYEQGGGEIVVLSGHYNLASEIEVSNKAGNLAITGEAGGTVFHMSDGIWLQSGEHTVSVGFSGITFEGEPSGGAYVGAQNASLAIRDCTIRNVEIGAQGAGENSFGFVFLRNRVEADGYAAGAALVNAVGSFPAGCFICGNEFYASSSTRLLQVLAQGENTKGKAVAMGNIVFETGADKSEVEFSQNVLAANNDFSNVDITARGIFTGNTVKNGSVYSGIGGLVSGNMVTGGYILAAGSSVVSGNKVEAETTGAIILQKNANNSEQDVSPSVVGNYITGGSVGILLQESNLPLPEISCALVTGNRIWGCETPIKIGSNWSRCMVTNNMFPEGGSVVDQGADNIVRLNSDDPGGGSGGGTAGVTQFNGRTGAVLPQNGDYTAAMVGAVSSGTAQAIQVMTQAEYDALTVKNPSTLYLIKE